MKTAPARLTLGLLALLIGHTAYRLSAPPRVSPSAQMTAPPLSEISGLALSPRHSLSPLHRGVLWAHNDSLDLPRLFAINERGELIAEHRVEGARNVDWEDIASAALSAQESPTGAPLSLLFVADSGNNLHWRDDLSVLAFEEPDDPRDTSRPLRPLGRLPYRFPQQRRRPPLAGEARCLDAEALFWRHGELYLVAKCFWGGRAPVYHLPQPPGWLRGEARGEARGEVMPPVTLEPIGELSLGAHTPPYGERVTAADWDPATDRLALLSYHGLRIYDLSAPPCSPLSPTSLHTQTWELLTRWPLRGLGYKQVEAVVWLDPQRVLIANEQRELYLVRTDDEARLLGRDPGWIQRRCEGPLPRVSAQPFKAQREPLMFD